MVLFFLGESDWKGFGIACGFGDVILCFFLCNVVGWGFGL